ncbi:C40 family peptidase [Streptosporangium sandarakinum]|uniref:Cell wall-associated NlpC family hydrolase n=1 Tax=Streptosporangium sandarakinum TaxID=1260955 RepID=A0A852UUC9_9ACTN|nr:C40 family peptidase [Streptosporangium sandarakinum]NYF38853.1 cell wall-associated NlpC family hydrolase [Streptosporangium sandarakinum]
MAAGLALALFLVPMGGAAADPRPTVAEAKRKLAKLNDQADKIVEKYNQAGEKWKKARKKYKALDGDLARQTAKVADLRKELVTMAVSSYQYGSVTGWEGLINQGDPGALLSSMAAADQMAAARARYLNAFDEATKTLRDNRNQAKAALNEADKTRDELAGEKAKVEKMVRAQTKLLNELGTYQQGNPNSTGIKYSGPASGNARTALAFAYAQIGKPYRFGGTGPGGWDCSGLVQASWRSGGVSLPRTTWEQWSWGASRRVPVSALQPGDLVFSHGLGHVGIYIGGGKMVHAPQTGDVVKISPLRSGLVGAVRP